MIVMRVKKILVFIIQLFTVKKKEKFYKISDQISSQEIGILS
jgi:hypothetical protein